MRKRREWDRITDVVKLVATTGLVMDVVARDRIEPVSFLLYGDPGTGKTALLKRFAARNPTLVFRDDLTWMGVIDLLQEAKHHAVSHVIFPEFQKIMQRKGDTWENTVGVLGQAIEDGVTDSQVGPRRIRLEGTRIGMIAAMTGDSFEGCREYFQSKGLLSRMIPVKWTSTRADAKRVYRRIRRGNKRDLTNVRIPEVRSPPVRVTIGESLGEQLERYVHQDLGMDFRDKRPVFQFRALLCAAALLRGGTRVRCASQDDLLSLREYDDVWKGAVR